MISIVSSLQSASSRAAKCLYLGVQWLLIACSVLLDCEEKSGVVLCAVLVPRSTIVKSLNTTHSKSSHIFRVRKQMGDPTEFYCSGYEFCIRACVTCVCVSVCVCSYKESEHYLEKYTPTWCVNCEIITHIHFLMYIFWNLHNFIIVIKYFFQNSGEQWHLKLF